MKLVIIAGLASLALGATPALAAGFFDSNKFWYAELDAKRRAPKPRPPSPDPCVCIPGSCCCGPVGQPCKWPPSPTPRFGGLDGLFR